MYIMINDVIGEKTIDLSYPIHSNAGWRKEIAVVRILLHRSIEVLSVTDRNGAEITNAGFP